MTQAYNLSQLANNLDSSGRLDATDGLVNAVPVANGGTGATTASAARTNLGAAASTDIIPSGCIVMWSGSIASIPSGWYLCNGSNGTPDLRDRFVVGAGSAYAVAASGGSKDSVVIAHTHTGTTSSAGTHTHNVTGSVVNTAYNSSNGTSYSASGTTPTSSAGAHTHSFTTDSTGSSGTDANLPPYYALAFIMKS